VPEISRFKGIIVGMYYSDHAPPHFHASHGSFEAVVEIETGLVNGNLRRSTLRDVQKWRKLHLDELQANWVRARNKQPLLPIDPLR
jgi:hypothetical protein